MNTETQSRKLRNLKAQLRRRAKRPARVTLYRCKGGPFDGQEIALTTGSTASFSCTANQVRYSGYYRDAAGTRYYNPHRATVVWQCNNLQWG